MRMRRLYVILLAVFLYPQLVQAQVSFDPGEGCLNVVDISVGKGLGENGGNVFSAYYLHERFINEQFSVGGGAGCSYLRSYEFSAIPLFYSTHYFFLDQRFSPFVNLRAGVYFPIGAQGKQPGISLYVAPSAGVKVHLTPRIGILASFGYDGYLVKSLDSVKNEYQSRMASSMGVSIGVCFQIPGW